MEHIWTGTAVEEQINLEKESTDEGIRRYFEGVVDAIKRGDGSRLRPVERLQAYWYDAVRLMVAEEIDAYRACKPYGPETYVGREIYGPLLMAAGPKTAAAAGVGDLTSLLLRESDGVKRIVAINTIGRAVVACLNSRLLKKTPGFLDDSTAWTDLTTQFQRLDARRINWWANKTMDDPVTEAKAIAAVGSCILSIIMQVCMVDDDGIHRPALYSFKKKDGNCRHSQWFLAFSDTASAAMAAGHDARATLRPTYMPMVVPPYPWQTDEHGKITNQGGYVSIRTPFVSGPTRRQKALLRQADLGVICEALNFIGSQPWRINDRVLKVQKHYLSKGGGVAGIPPTENPKLRPMPPGRKTDYVHEVQEFFKHRDRAGLTLSAGAEWLLEARRHYRSIVNLSGERELMYGRLGWAERFSGRKIYFPHKCDFRGRFYPVPPLLNHQGEDLCRGLLLFADPGPSHARSHYWLAVHAANMFGHDKKSLDDRFAWARANASDIYRSAANPTEHEFWLQAEKPWQFLAACMGLADDEVGAMLPTQTDGSCNGLQHYSAMSLDAVGGALVNLLPSTSADTPTDVYMAVAARVPGLIDPKWHKYVNRKSCKQPVMTTYYGVTEQGARGQVENALADQGYDRKEAKAAARVIGPAILAAIGDTCPGASGLMAWLRDTARTISTAGYPVEFVGPMGFPVSVPYRRRTTTQVNTPLGSISTLAEHEDDPIWVEKQVNGSAPHVVHQVDSCHVIDAALRCKSSGMAFASVHDCFWTHAGSKDQLEVHLRDGFVDLHAADIPQMLYEQFKNTHADLDIQPPPNKGSLDLGGIRVSANCFS